MTPSGSTTPSPAAAPARSTEAPPTARIGDTVLVRMDTEGNDRPLLVTWVGMVPIYDRATPTVDNPTAKAIRNEMRLSGVLFCEPDDHTRPLLRGAYDRPHDPARIQGRPDRQFPFLYAEFLSYGHGPGQWRTR